jgi:hypothetical protein
MLSAVDVELPEFLVSGGCPSSVLWARAQSAQPRPIL